MGQPKRAKTTPATPPSQQAEPPARTPQIRAQQRAKNGGNEPTLRWRTLMRKRVKTQQEEKGKVSLFRSPSIFDEDDKDGDGPVMAKYLAGQMGALTPSQAPTNVAHLVKYKPAAVLGTPDKRKRACTDGSTLSESFSLKTPKTARQDSENACLPSTPSSDASMPTVATEPSNNYCSIM